MATAASTLSKCISSRAVARDLRERRRIAGQPAKHAGAAFGRLDREEWRAGGRATARARSTSRLPRAGRRSRARAQARAAAWPSRFRKAPARAAEAATRSCCPGRSARRAAVPACLGVVVVPFILASGPAAGRGIDAEAENALFLAASQALVEPADGRAWGVGERQNRTGVIACHSLVTSSRAVAPRPGEHGLDLEALALPILVVGRDPLGGRGLDIVDAQHVADRMNAAHRRVDRRGSARVRRADARRRIRRKHRRTSVARRPPSSARMPGGSLAL